MCLQRSDLAMEMLEMTTTGGNTSSDSSHAGIVDSITQLIMVASGTDEPRDFEITLKQLLTPLDASALLSVRKKLGDYSTDDLRVFGHAVYSIAHPDEDHYQLPGAGVAIPFYAETTPTAVNFLGSGSTSAAASVLIATCSTEYSLLLRAEVPNAIALGRAAVMCRSINGGVPLAVGGVFGKKFVSPYSGTMTFEDLAWLGRQEQKLVPHAEYLRQHKTYARHFIEKLLSANNPPPAVV